ncbi:MAG: alpha/beta hydrolase [Bacteroidetes bacterium]|nr:alpha/beta hydrolase [Bacteroidota bacterium]
MKAISKDGTQIAYDKTGKGPALILVDGAFCYRQNGVTPRIVQLLCDNFTVYSYDRRGRGESTDTKPYSVEREIEDLDAIIEVTNETPFMCGISSGACLLIQAAGKGSKAKKIVLFEPPYVVASETDQAPPKDAKTVLENFSQQEQRSKAVYYFMAKVMGMPAIIVFLFKLFGRSAWKKNESVAHTLSYDVEIMGNYYVPVELSSKITCPTLIVGGEKSPKKLINAVKKVEKNIPNSELKLLKGQSHNISMKILAAELITFFSS